tara:strand:+ start:496 stop:618 length:123 start_codon:yes stop_codon:yes gene_type:complete
MKKLALFSLTIFLIALLSSCAIYEEPCEGVAQINPIEANS